MHDSSSNLKPLLCLFATGGTIAGAQASSTRGGYHSAALSIEALVAAVPQLTELARLELKQIARIGSQDMDDALWLKLAEASAAALARPEVQGLVITHGTDTMEETAYFLHLALKTAKPVVLVGAMRPANSISADGPMNLYNALAIAAHPEAAGRGVLVVANDEVHSARAVAKTNTTQVGTFRSINRGLAALVQQGRVHWFGRPSTQHTEATLFDTQGLTALPRVEIIFAHAGMGSELIEAATVAGAKGIVIAGVGSGNLHAKALKAAAAASAAGLVIVRASRTGGGMVERNVELDDDSHRFVTAGDLNPQKARVLLQLALMKSSDPARIQAWFDVC